MALNFTREDQRLSVHFLDYLNLDETSKYQEIRASLLYLDRLVSRGDQDHPDTLNFTETLFDVCHKLQTEYLSGRLEEDDERLLELFQQEINALFGSLPSELQGYHNLTLNILLEPQPEIEPALEVTPELQLEITAAKAGKKLKPKNLLKVLAACAALSLSGSEKPSNHPEGVYFKPEALSLAIQAQVEAVVTLPAPLTQLERTAPPSALETPAAPEPFALLQQAPYPVEIVADQTREIATRLESVLSTPERSAVFEMLRQHPNYRSVISLLAVIESDVNPDAVSHSGAMGILQDMGELQGAFGDPDTVAHLASIGLMPEVEDATYNRIIALHQRGTELRRGLLLEYLIAQRSENTPFWQAFVTAQEDFIRTPETSAAIAHQYLEDLQAKAISRLPINDNSLEALNFAVMSYNLGMTHLHTLHRIMTLNGVTEFTTYNVLEFMGRPDFETILRDNNLGRLHNNFKEARDYLSRFIALQEIVHHNPRV